RGVAGPVVKKQGAEPKLFLNPSNKYKNPGQNNNVATANHEKKNVKNEIGFDMLADSPAK
ncbi:hypothetical protein ACNIRS_25640, partial [Escherichia coli]